LIGQAHRADFSCRLFHTNAPTEPSWLQVTPSWPCVATDHLVCGDTVLVSRGPFKFHRGATEFPICTRNNLWKLWLMRLVLICCAGSQINTSRLETPWKRKITAPQAATTSVGSRRDSVACYWW